MATLETSEIDVGRAGRLGRHLNVHLGVEIDFILHDLVDDDLHFVVVLGIHQRPRAAVKLHQSLLDQGGKLETAADLFDNRASSRSSSIIFDPFPTH